MRVPMPDPNATLRRPADSEIGAAALVSDPEAQEAVANAPKPQPVDPQIARALAVSTLRKRTREQAMRQVLAARQADTLAAAPPGELDLYSARGGSVAAAEDRRDRRARSRQFVAEEREPEEEVYAWGAGLLANNIRLASMT